MKKTISTLLCTSAIILMTSQAFGDTVRAAQTAHYGKPNTSATQKLRKNNDIPFTLTNNTYSQYYVTLTQASGHVDANMLIQSVNNYPLNVISIDHPSWPVHVDVSYQPYAAPFMSEDVYPDQPNATISNNTTHNVKNKLSVSLTVSP